MFYIILLRNKYNKHHTVRACNYATSLFTVDIAFLFLLNDSVAELYTYIYI